MSSSVLCVTSIPGFIDSETAPSPALSPAIAPCPLTTRLIALSSHRMVHVDEKGISSGSSKVVYFSADLDMSSSGSDVSKLEERGYYRKHRYWNYYKLESGLTLLGSIMSSHVLYNADRSNVNIQLGYTHFRLLQIKNNIP